MFNKCMLVAIYLLFVASSRVTSQGDGEEGKTIEVELKNTANGRLFYVELGVGQQETESYRKFNMLVASDYFMTWIPSRYVDLERGYESSSHGTFNNNQNIMKSGGGYGGYHFKVHNETCQIGSQLVEDQPMAIAKPSHRHRAFPRQYNIDGVLGLSGYDNIPEGTHYLFRNLFHSGHIDKLQYSLYINNTLRNKSNGKKTYGRRGTTGGALVLGGIDKKYFKGEIKYALLYDEWDASALRPHMGMNKSLLVTKVEFDWSRTSWETQSKGEIKRLLTNKRLDLSAPEAHLRLDSSMILFVGPDRLLDHIHLDFIGATKVGTRHFYVFDDCQLDNKPDLVFTVDHLELVVRPEDYVIQDELDGRKVCISAFAGYPEMIWAFGTQFMRNYYTVFDYESHAIGFATPA